MATIIEIKERVDKLEELIADNQKAHTVELKALGTELKACIADEFRRCRELAPLTCPIGKNRITIPQAAGLCTVIIGVFVTLAKLGVFTGLIL